MTTLPQPFDPNQVPPDTGGADQLPVSDANGHIVVIVGDSMVATKDGTGQYLQFDLQIVDGPAAGQTGPVRLNIANQSADAVRIAYGQLSSICHVIGHLQPLQDLSALHNKPFRVVVALQKGNEEKGYTEVKKYLTLEGNKPGQTAAPAPAPAPSTSGAFTVQNVPATGFPQPQPQVPAQPQPQVPAGVPTPPWAK